MSYQVYTEEMLAALIANGAPNARDLQGEFEALARRIHEAGAEFFKVKAEIPWFDMGRAGGAIYPTHKGQALPEALAGLDDPCEWDDDETETVGG